nr:helix-turn-helix domain-containing protein [Limosilactobacillus reuteri]
MTHLNDTMSTSLLTTHKKNAHLTKEERVMIATLKSQGLCLRLPSDSTSQWTPLSSAHGSDYYGP